jgi:hypothetical protein
MTLSTLILVLNAHYGVNSTLKNTNLQVAYLFHGFLCWMDERYACIRECPLSIIGKGGIVTL